MSSRLSPSRFSLCRCLAPALVLSALAPTVWSQPIGQQYGADDVASVFDMQHPRYGVKTPVSSQGFELRVVQNKKGETKQVSAKGPDGVLRLFDLSSIAGVVHRMWVADGRLVVCAWANHSLRGDVTLFDLASGRQLDNFWGQNVSASPDGRRIAFERFHPAPFAPQGESQYRLYDVFSTPQANRPSYSKKHPAGPTDGDTLSNFAPGVALYPLSARELARSTVVDAAADRHVSLSRLVWSADGRELAVLDAHAGKAWLVMIDTSRAVYPGAVPAYAAALPELAKLCSVVDADDPEQALDEDCVSTNDDRVDLRFERDAVVVSITPSEPGQQGVTARVSRQRLKPVAQARYGDDAE
ncbi:hypothetical protein [Ideonella sp.]|uniref:hypothetical protein n=1 Tax=Ideonella sp. TaxID=1929293 RepID=UPI0035B03075